jgi:hypothetical protein
MISMIEKSVCGVPTDRQVTHKDDNVHLLLGIRLFH